MAAGPYDAAGNVTLADFEDVADFDDREAESEIQVDLRMSWDNVQSGTSSGFLTASSSRSSRKGAWTKVGKRFSPPIDLSALEGLGVWVYGDGKGEVLNFQVRSPEHVVAGIGEHYVIVDFMGWRYFELIEPEGGRYADYAWPYGHAYAIYRERVQYDQVAGLCLWYNNLPPNDAATCYLSPIKALPLVNATLINPAVTLGDRRILFPTDIESGCYLEFHSMSDCKLYGPQGELIREVVPEGGAPVVEAGENLVSFTCDVQGDINPRAFVTVISRGESL